MKSMSNFLSPILAQKKLAQISLILALALMPFNADAQKKLAQDALGKFLSTTVIDPSSALTDTSAAIELPARATGFILGGVVDTGKVAFIVQAAMKYNATASKMKYFTVDSLVGATAPSAKAFTTVYPYIRIIRSRWNGGTTKWGAYSAAYIFPVGAK